jgi:hypothetical protein
MFSEPATAEIFVFLAVASSVDAGSSDPSDGIRRLEPTAFPDPPRAVAGDLTKRGCTIPQTYLREEPHNAVSGHFKTPDEIDYAVLCSIGGQSTLLVYLGPFFARVDVPLGATRDEAWLQEIGESKLGFSRLIGLVGEAYILEQYQRYGGEPPPPIEHDGIDHAFAGKASTVLYWHDGKWLELTGAD